MKRSKFFNQKGQIAVILIFFIAVLLAAFAVIVNIGKISQGRVSEAIAADSAAAVMASSIASYAESWYQSIIFLPASDVQDEHSCVHESGEETGRPLTRKATSDVWTAIAGFALAVIGIVLCATGVFGPAGVGLIAVASVVLAAAGVVIQLAYVQPSMVSLWNRMLKNLPVAAQFREQGVQTAFGYVAQDPVLVDDVWDLDQDGTFKGDGTPEGDKEKVGRFSYLYTKRIEWLSTTYYSGSLNGDPPAEVIYGWRDEDKPGQTPGSGKWHIVRVRAHVPTACPGQADACARTVCETSEGGCLEPYMPNVIAWGHDVSTRYWFSLVDFAIGNSNGDITTCKQGGLCGIGNNGNNTCGDGYDNKESLKSVTKCFKGGLVRAEVTRYDESGGALNWATGVNFWNMTFKNPNAPSATLSPDNIEDADVCDLKSSEDWETPDGGDSYALSTLVGTDKKVWAFVLNKPSTENAQCWNLVNELLGQGTQTQSCAEYYARHSPTDYGDSGAAVGYRNSRFAMKFVPCPARTWLGVDVDTGDVDTGDVDTGPCAGIVCSDYSYYCDAFGNESGDCLLQEANGCCWKHFHLDGDPSVVSPEPCDFECVTPGSVSCKEIGSTISLPHDACIWWD